LVVFPTVFLAGLIALLALPLTCFSVPAVEKPPITIRVCAVGSTAPDEVHDRHDEENHHENPYETDASDSCKHVSSLRKAW
jgi:hypothetical protein